MSVGAMTFVCTPSVLLVTYTLIWQVAPAEIVPFVSEIEVAPVTAVITAEDPQLFCVAGEELLTVTPGGRLSTIEKFVRSVSSGAEILIRKREFPPG